MYTKGEWKVKKLPITGGLVIYANGELIAGGLEEANAQLIAKSPKMYELLCRLAEIGFSTDDENYEALQPILDEARELAKAEDTTE